MIEDKCICGHDSTEHRPYKFGSLNVGGWESACHGDSDNEEDLGVCRCNKFKLDNLRLVEDTAKERGLV